MKTYYVSRMHFVTVGDFIDAKDEINALEIFKRNLMNGEYNEPLAKESFYVDEFNELEEDDEDINEDDEFERLIEIKKTMSLDEMFDVLRERRKVSC